MKIRVRIVAEEWGSGAEKLSHTQVVFMDSPMDVIRELRDVLKSDTDPSPGVRDGA